MHFYVQSVDKTIEDSKWAKKALEDLIDFVSKNEHLPKEVKRTTAKIAKSYRLGQEGDLDALSDVYYIELFFAEGIIDRWEADALAADDLQKRKPKGELQAITAYLDKFGGDEGWGKHARVEEVHPKILSLSNLTYSHRKEA